MTIDLHTGTQYAPRPSDYCTKAGPVPAGGECPLWRTVQFCECPLWSTVHFGECALWRTVHSCECPLWCCVLCCECPLWCWEHCCELPFCCDLLDRAIWQCPLWRRMTPQDGTIVVLYQGNTDW